MRDTRQFRQAPSTIHHQRSDRAILRAAAALVLSLSAVALPAHAETTGESSAYGESVAIEATLIGGGSASVVSGPLPSVSGTAPPPYSLSQSAASASAASAPTGTVLQTGLLEVDAASLVPNADQASAQATVHDVDLDLIGTLLIFGLTATTVESRVEISGDCSGSGLSAEASTILENAQADGPLGSGLVIAASPAPNTVLLDSQGIRVVLNEQSVGGNGQDSLSASVNAVHVTLSDVGFTGVGTLNGDIVIGHAEAEVVCGEGDEEPEGDRDGDGVPDAEDNCPDTPNPGQQDSDGDGVGDACEPAGEPDRDGDGVPDAEDNCPSVPNPGQQDSDGDGIGDACELVHEPDRDGDGVLDLEDNCPDVPNAGQIDSNGDEIGDACSPTVIVPSADERPDCCVDVAPAATLLIPYFEVDLSSAAGATTLFSVLNSTSEARLTSITLWTDWAVPTLTFNVFLSGFDVQSFNLRDLLVLGSLPRTGPGVSSPGNLSDDFSPIACTAADLTRTLSAEETAELRAAHTGRPSPSSGLCSASPRSDSSLATGYVTVDAVNRCSSLNPSDAGYFADGGTGVASNDNVLLGDVLWIDPAEDFAQGDAAVHVRANAEAFGEGDYTFYRRYVGAAGADNRQPLGTAFAARYLEGGPFTAGTDLLVWRDTERTTVSPVACGGLPAFGQLSSRPIVVWDEEENAVSLLGTSPFRWATQRVRVGTELAPLHPFGWMQIDLSLPGGLFADASQGWVIPLHQASGRFSVGGRAFRLSSPCGE